jgi:hypothetical protein
MMKASVDMVYFPNDIVKVFMDMLHVHVPQDIIKVPCDILPLHGHDMCPPTHDKSIFGHSKCLTGHCTCIIYNGKILL